MTYTAWCVRCGETVHHLTERRIHRWARKHEARRFIATDLYLTMLAELISDAERASSGH